MNTQNKRFSLALMVAALVGVAGFNLDIPGNWLLASGRADLVLPCLQTMTSFSNDLHISNSRTADALAHLAQCYAAAEQFDDAIKVDQQAINMYKQTIGEETTPVFLGMARLGSYLNDTGHYERAEMILNNAAQRLEHTQVPDIEAQALVYASLSDSLVAQGKNAKATAMLEKLLPVDERLMIQKQRSVDAYDKLAALYARAGRINLSKQTIEAGIAIKERILGSNNVQIATSYKRLAELQTAQR